MKPASGCDERGSSRRLRLLVVIPAILESTAGRTGYFRFFETPPRAPLAWWSRRPGSSIFPAVITDDREKEESAPVFRGRFL